MEKNAKIFVAGHNGLLGSTIIKRLKKEGYKNIITRSHSQMDLTRQSVVEKFFDSNRPQYVILCAAKVGGIKSNMNNPADFIYENLAIELNVINASYRAGVKKLLFFGSACSYPKDASQPMKEKYLLQGEPEPTNEAYAMAKLAGIKLCQAYNRQYRTDFISAIPINAYGPGDNFDYEDSHVIPALIRKFHEAKVRNKYSVTLWGSGRPLREFIYVDDLAAASIFLMNIYNDPTPINIGSGEEITIRSLAEIVKQVTGFNGRILFDTVKPDGAKRKLIDSTKINQLGWKAQIGIYKGIEMTYAWYLKKYENKS